MLRRLVGAEAEVPRPDASMRRTTFSPIALLACLAALVPPACADLSDFPADRCGNAVLDAGEDCDTHAADAGAPCGAPGTVEACRFVCPADEAGERPGCPSGSVCSVDGVCTRPSDAFVPRQLLPHGGDVLGTGDLDGDDRREVVIGARAARVLRVSFFDRLAEPATVELPADGVLTMAVGRVDVDDRADIAVPSDAAVLQIGTSGSGRTLAGGAFAPYDFAFLTRVAAVPAQASYVPQSLPDGLEALEPDAQTEGVFLPFESEARLFIRNPYDGGTPSTGSLPFPVSGILSVTHAPVIRRPVGPACDELVITHRGPAPGVVILPVCTVGPSADASVGWGHPIYRLPGAASLPAEALEPDVAALEVGEGTVDASFVLDDDGDGIADVLVATSAPRRLVRFAGDGFGGFDAGREIEAPGAGRILGVVHLDDDGRPDFITATGVYRSRPGGGFYRAGAPVVGPWREAVAADFDGDGLLDVVGVPERAGGALATDVDVLVASGLSYFNPRKIVTPGEIGLLTIGDFDGDGFADVAARQRFSDPPSDPEATFCDLLDEVLVFYGAASAPLGERTVAARAPGLEQFVPGRLPRLDKRDGISDFGVVSSCRPDESRVAVFYGAAGRQVAAPFLLNDALGAADPEAPVNLVPHRPISIGVGGHQDERLTAVLARASETFQSPGVGQDLTLFLLRSEEGATFGRTHVVAIADEVPELAEGSGMAAVADLDGDGDAEVLVGFPTEVGLRLLLVSRWLCADEASDDPGTCGDPEDRGTLADLSPPEGAARIDRWIVADVDGDGFDDVVVATDDGASGRLHVLWGGGGGLPSTLQEIALPEGSGPIGGLALLPRYGGAPRVDDTGRPIPEASDLVVALGGRLVRLAQGAEARSFALTEGQLEVPDDGGGEIRGIGVDDVDGDRFEDVVILRETSTQALLRAPRLTGDDLAGGSP